MKALIKNDTIAALASAHGVGAIALIRVTGPSTFSIVSEIFFDKDGKPVDINAKKGFTIHYGEIRFDELILDEVLISVFKNPKSYTGEDMIEISCHGSEYIQQQLLSLLFKKGCRSADPGEFTMRAFLNGKLDLSQAEAVADLISSNSGVSHQVAMQQMRGGFSGKIKTLRSNLVDFASLIELELDFSEEDVEFADREDLKKLLFQLQNLISKLVDSFDLGNVIKNGIPVAIVGKPNAGKSTLLNALLEEERAIVSEIPGTTRDTIEDELRIDGVLFRFIDTAGIRQTQDVIESLGVNKTFESIRQASIVLYVFDVHSMSSADLDLEIDQIKIHSAETQLLIVANKIDEEDLEYLRKEFEGYENLIFISAKEKMFIEDLKMKLVTLFDQRALQVTETVVTNARHADALRKANSALHRVMEGLSNRIPGDLLAQDIRYALNSLGEITGEVTSDDLLGNIFGKFCIGK
ncbi:MAG: tRNA uridine-5-carboxymethylaminomethyl(34) synthesis GTPase MnmE [Bacteroidota bacterium]|jgi:tRNA modification GTPase